MRGVLVVAGLLILACGGDDDAEPESQAETICRRLHSCPNLEMVLTYEACIPAMEESLAYEGPQCGNCMEGLSCLGLEQVVQDRSSSLCWTNGSCRY